MDKWQPFVTAPENGTFLVWMPEKHTAMNSHVGVMRRHPKVSFIYGLIAFDLQSDPSHWMPLPDPPETGGAP